MLKITRPILLCTLFVFNQLCYAEIPTPTKCPSVSAIKKEGVNKVEFSYPICSHMVSHEPDSTYDTDQPWHFEMCVDSLFDSWAMAQAKRNLNSLELVSSTPRYERVGRYEEWTCVYRVKGDDPRTERQIAKYRRVNS